jgi:CBS domain containing-hemolysin-like protein
VSRDEIRALADLGAQQGVLDEDESRLVESLLRFRSMNVSQVMTPRTVIFGLPADETVGEIVERHQPLRYSRIPIYRGSIDSLAGVVLKDEILESAAKGRTDVELIELRRELFFVPGTLRLSHLLELFLSSREHIAAVVDEFGGTAGLVTLEDLIETLLDLEIVDEIDNVEDLRAAARSKWRRRAQALGVLTSDREPKPAADATREERHTRRDSQVPGRTQRDDPPGPDHGGDARLRRRRPGDGRE